VKTFWNPELVNTKHQVILNEIDEDGMVKVDFINASVLAE
jgi:threonylcarbamoyladenosine tRNA methylthiotransferase MtaB